MAKQLNKHTPNSDELFNRLKSHDSEGLDDFEKEALEGFESLQNDELARSLQTKLNARIDEVYFEKKSGNKTLYYLSMAAGLVLVIGLSVLFYNILGNQKDELALNKEAIETEKLPEQMNSSGAGSGSDAIIEEKSAEAIQPPHSENKQQPLTPAQPAKSLSSREDAGAGQPAGTTKVDVHTATPATENDDKKPKDIYNGPEIAAAPVQLEEKNQLAAGSKAEEGEFSNTKTGADKDMEDAKARSTVATGGLKKSAYKSEAKRKEKSMAPGEAVASDDVAYPSAPSVISTKSNVIADEASVVAPSFKFKSFTKAQDYIKSEIDKNEKLKMNVKEFIAKVTINETGKVTKVKFLNSFGNCTECESLLETVILNMPNWNPAQQGGKSVKETIHFVYP